MSVLVRGAEMPSCCMFCPISNAVGCRLTNPPVIMTTREMLAGRPDWCPLVALPAHGRLGDLDKLKKQATKRLYASNHGSLAEAYYSVIIGLIDDTPTILSAEDMT